MEKLYKTSVEITTFFVADAEVCTPDEMQSKARQALMDDIGSTDSERMGGLYSLRR